MSPAARPATSAASRYGRLAWRLAGACLALWLGGCASLWSINLGMPADLPAQVELAEVPFYPDDSHYCGPAALATGLAAAGRPVALETLADEIFLPGRNGTLQIEMLAGARRHGALPVPIPGTLEALLRELAAGQPVIILQNLGLSWVPVWHYATAVGYDLERGEILLRSGPRRREIMPLRTFMNTWERSQNWAFVALPPGRLPVTASLAEVTRALLAYERVAPSDAAVAAYRAAYQHWPDDITLAMGLGNSFYASGQRQAAAEVYRRLAERQHVAAAYNNLARLLLEEGALNEARQVAEEGLNVAGPLRDTLLATQLAIAEASARLPAAATDPAVVPLATEAEGARRHKSDSVPSAIRKTP